MISYLLVIACALVSAGANTDVDVEYAFHNYAHAFCGSGGVDFLDIGHGNFRSTAAVGQFDFPLSSDQMVGMVPGSTGLFNESGVATNLRGASPRDLAGYSSGCGHPDCGPCCTSGNEHQWCDANNHLTGNRCMGAYSGSRGFKYSNMVTHTDDSAWTFTEWFDNDSSAEQSFSFTKSETTTASNTWTSSTTIHLGVSTSIKVGVPFAEATDTFSLDVTNSLGKSQTHTKAQTWSASQMVNVPKKSTMKATMVVKKTTMSGQFTAVMDMPYYARLWCHDTTNNHREWFVPAQNFLPHAYPDVCSGETCNLHGAFTGWQGVSATVQLKQCKLNSRSC